MLTKGPVVLNIFEKKSSSMVGIDISSTAVKLLELGKVKDRYRVDSYSVIPLQPETIVDKVIKQPGQLADTIKKAVLKAGCHSKRAAVAVTDSSVITKVIKMDKSLNDEQMETHIAIEAEKYIPYPLEEVNFDFDVIGEISNADELVDVLLVASRTDNVESKVGVVENAGLEVGVVDVESYAAERACYLISDQLPNEGKDKVIAVVDIGATATNLTVLQNLTTIFTREEIFGGNLLTKEIQRHYNLSYAKAGLAKKSGDLPDDYVTEILEPFKESAVLQVRRALQFFFSANQSTTVDHLVLAGGTAAMPGLAELIEEKIGIATTVANPFNNMIISKRVDTTALTKDAAALIVCCGLAMRSFDNDKN